MRARELHSNYYRDRWSESDLCNDFPGDEILIDGLHAMQRHFYTNGVSLTIPVVRVMNAAHFLAAYMFSTTCSGDQTEYDALADISLGQDKQMFRLTMIVLAAMLKRTEGFKARQCRNLILDNRDPDFEEGVTLYDRFLRSAEKRFAEEDFLIDTHTRIQCLTAENEQLIAENKELKYKYQLMENQQNIQYKQDNNQGTIYNAPVYITYTSPAPSTATPEPKPTEEATPASDIFCRITKAAKDKGIAQKIEEELRSACVSAPKLIGCIRTNEALGYLDTQNLSSTDLYNLLDAHFHLPFKLRTFQENRSK